MSEETNFTRDLDAVAQMGKEAAEAKSFRDFVAIDEINNSLVEFVQRVPQRYQQQMLTTYAIAYVKHLQV